MLFTFDLYHRFSPKVSFSQCLMFSMSVSYTLSHCLSDSLSSQRYYPRWIHNGNYQGKINCVCNGHKPTRNVRHLVARTPQNHSYFNFYWEHCIISYPVVIVNSIATWLMISLYQSAAHPSYCCAQQQHQHDDADDHNNQHNTLHAVALSDSSVEGIVLIAYQQKHQRDAVWAD